MTPFSQNFQNLQSANFRNFTDYSQVFWAEVTKANPCPFCGKPDWCSVAENGEAVLCRRTDVAPIGWKYQKNSKDGYPIYVREKYARSRHNRSRPKAPQKPKAQRVAPPDTIRLTFLPKDKQTAPQPRKLLNSDGSYRLITRYGYSSDKWVERIEFYDAQDNRTKKQYRQWHRTEDGSEICKKGDAPWPAYRIEEAIAALKEAASTNPSTGNCVLAVEGEPCTEAGRSLGFATITSQGSSWSKQEIIENELRPIKAASSNAGLIIWGDNDKEGNKKNLIRAEACNEVGLWYHIINPEDFELPEKGDIVDAIKMHGEDEVRRRLERILHSIPAQYEDEFTCDSDPSTPNSFSPTPDTLSSKVEFTQRALSLLYSDKPWINVANTLYYWTGNHYKESSDGAELKRLTDFADNYAVIDKFGDERYPYAKPSKTREALQWVKDSLWIDPDLVNPPGINCTNGVLQIKWDESAPSWELVPHDPSMYYLYKPIARYNPLANPENCTKLLSALDTSFQEIFLRTIAASLDLSTVRKYKGRLVRALLCKGDGSNGKDTLRELVAAMYGYQGMTGATVTDFVQYDEGRKFPLAKLEKSRVNWASENASFANLDKIQSLKAFITGDPIDKEQKGKDEREFTPVAIALFNCNDTPNLTGAIEAILSRYGVLPFTKTFKIGANPSKGEIEADPRYKYDPDFLRERVLPAFLNRVLAALVDLMREGIDYSCMQETLEEIQAENSHLFQFCQDTSLGYVTVGLTTIGSIWERLEAWYIANGTLTYEETANGKKKAIWLDQVKKNDTNVKGANQVLARFLQLFPKAKRVKITSGENKNQVALQGIAFTCGNGGGDGGSSIPPPTPPPGKPVGGESKPVVSQSVSQLESPEVLPNMDSSNTGKPGKPVLDESQNLKEAEHCEAVEVVAIAQEEVKQTSQLPSLPSFACTEQVTDLPTALPTALPDTQTALPDDGLRLEEIAERLVFEELNAVLCEENEKEARKLAQTVKASIDNAVKQAGERGEELRRLVWNYLTVTEQTRIKELLAVPKPSASAQQKEQSLTEINGLKVGDRAICTSTNEEVIIERFFERNGVMFATIKYLSPAYLCDSMCGESRVDWLKAQGSNEEKKV